MWLERARRGENADQLERAYEELIGKIKRVDPVTLARLCGGSYKSDGMPRVEIAFLSSWFVLDLVPYHVRAAHEHLDTLPMRVLVLSHLLTAAENQGTAVRVMGQWIDCRSLQHGAVMGAHFSRSTTDSLALFFQRRREERISKALQWGGKPHDLGDTAFHFEFFPRLPVVLVHWEGDEEFRPYSKVLFDVSASNYMTTHGLVALTDFLIHRLAE